MRAVKSPKLARRGLKLAKSSLNPSHSAVSANKDESILSSFLGSANFPSKAWGDAKPHL
jgi:hypothetical protein